MKDQIWNQIKRSADQCDEDGAVKILQIEAEPLLRSDRLGVDRHGESFDVGA